MVNKTYLKVCSQCDRLFYSVSKNHKPKCLICKIANGSFAEARKEFDLLVDSDLREKRKRAEKIENAR